MSMRRVCVPSHDASVLRNAVQNCGLQSCVDYLQDIAGLVLVAPAIISFTSRLQEQPDIAASASVNNSNRWGMCAVLAVQHLQLLMREQNV